MPQEDVYRIGKGYAAACKQKLGFLFGGRIGAGWVSKWKVNTVRIAISVCLLATAIVVILRQFGIGPYAGENEALPGLHGVKLIVALVINFVLGMLMNLGFGLYAPYMGMLQPTGTGMDSTIFMDWRTAQDPAL